MDPKAILLNGPSSSGKSTLAAALKKICPEFAVVSIDEFLEMTAQRNIYEDDVYEIMPALCEKTTRLLETGQSVIIDHVIISERIFTQMIETLAGYPVLTVRVTCPAEELRRREQARGDRYAGMAEISEEFLYPKEGYGLTVESFSASPEENARQIAEKLKDPA